MAITAALSPLDINLPHPLPGSSSRRLGDGKQPPRVPVPRRQSDYHLIQNLRAVPPSALPSKPTSSSSTTNSTITTTTTASSTIASPHPRKSRPLHPPLSPCQPTTKPKTPHKPLHKKYLCATPPVFLRNKRRNLTYDRGRQLGEGGFARCYLVQNKEGKLFAAKTVAKQSLGNPRMRQKFFGEIHVQKMMRHPNVVRFNECFEDENNIYLILELCSNKSLVEMLRRRSHLTEPEARHITLQLLGALKYMHHTKHVIHRDLKLGNIFLDSYMNVKIGDFGLAALLVSSSDRKTTMCGTPNYIAPEVLYGSKSCGGDGSGHSFEVDLWSMGVIIYALLVGKPPFQAKEVEEIYRNIKECKVGFPEDCRVSGGAKALVKSLLHTDPERRPGIDSIVEHPWFRQGWFPRTIPETALVKEPVWRSSRGELIPAEGGLLSESLRRESRRNYWEVARKAGVGVDENGVEFPCVGDKEGEEEISRPAVVRIVEVPAVEVQVEATPPVPAPAPAPAPAQQQAKRTKQVAEAAAATEKARKKEEKDAAAARAVAQVIEDARQQQKLQKENKNVSSKNEYLLPESLSPRDGRARMRGTALLRNAAVNNAANAPKRPSGLGPNRAAKREVVVIEEDEEAEDEEAVEEVVVEEPVKKGRGVRRGKGKEKEKEKVKEEAAPAAMGAPRRPRRAATAAAGRTGTVGTVGTAGTAELKAMKPDVDEKATAPVRRRAGRTLAAAVADARLAEWDREKEEKEREREREKERARGREREREKEREKGLLLLLRQQQQAEELARANADAEADIAEAARLAAEREALTREREARILARQQARDRREADRQAERAARADEEKEKAKAAEKAQAQARAAMPPPPTALPQRPSRRAAAATAAAAAVSRPTSAASASHISANSTAASSSSSNAMDPFPTAPNLSLAIGAPIQNTSTSSILDSLHSHITFLTTALTTLAGPTASSAKAKEEIRQWRSGARNKSVFITKWVDYTNKFGIGYVLTDGTVGVMFNDNSGIVCEGLPSAAGSTTSTGAAGEAWYLTQGYASHTHRRTTPGGTPPGGLEAVYKKYTTHMPTLLRERSAVSGSSATRYAGRLKLPADFEIARMGGGLVVNKVGMWRRFGAFMRDNLEGGEEFVFTPHSGGAGFGETREIVFVTNYARMRDGAVFRFSNGAVQLVSVDHTKIVLEQGAGVVRFLGRKGKIWVLGTEEVRQVVAASSSSIAEGGGQLRREEVRELREEGLEGRLAFLRGFLRGWWREGKVPGVRRRVGQGGGVREEGERAAKEEVVVLGEVEPGADG